MLKGVVRVFVLLVLALMVAPLGFAGGRPSPDAAKNKKEARAKNTAKKAEKAKATAANAQAKRLSPEALKVTSQGVGEGIGQWVPMPATAGAPGLFTVQTGLTLPKGAFAIDAYANKFGRSPGSLTILNVGWSFDYGITNRIEAYFNWDAYRHIHTGYPGELSLNANPDKPFYDGTIYHVPFLPATDRPSYAEDFPFAYTNNGGIGPIMLGLKYGILSEARGDKLSLAIRDEAYIPTHSNSAAFVTNNPVLLQGGVQTGAFSDLIGATVSKTFAGVVTWTFDYGHLFTRDPRGGGATLLHLADQEKFGTGFLFFPDWRVQPMTEFTGIVFDGTATPTTTFGPRDPVDGVWGVRFYPWHPVAVDIGYRYMLNLPQILDRNGFVIKISTEYWPHKPAPVDNVTVQCSADKHSVQEGSDERVNLTATGNDTLGHTLTYTWTATGGSIRGSGSSVEWDSTGVAPGKYTVTVRADDSYGNEGTCSEEIEVTPKPAIPPVLACSSARPSILPGERVGITANANDTSGTGLTYTWRTTGGAIIGSGPTVEFDSTGLAPGVYTITARVENGKGMASDCNVEVTVQAPPPPKPQASKIDQCYFRMRSTRIDNVCKRILDNVALRLQNETGAHVVVIGYATPGKNAREQRFSERRAGLRAANAKKYLVSKGVSADRIETRTGTGTAGAGKENRRIELIWVPEGATY